MKFLTTLVLLLMSSTTVLAQTALDQQIELARQAANLDRQALLMGNVQLTACLLYTSDAADDRT